MTGWDTVQGITKLVSSFPWEHVIVRRGEPAPKEKMGKTVEDLARRVHAGELTREQAVEELQGKLAPTPLRQKRLEPCATCGIQKTRGTACLPCARDHFGTVSGAISEAVRFARESGVRHPEVTRRLRIALDELNILERIDLAPSEMAALVGSERETAEGALVASRGLRHAITDIKDVRAMEQAAAKASEAHEAVLRHFWQQEDEHVPSG